MKFKMKYLILLCLVVSLTMIFSNYTGSVKTYRKMNEKKQSFEEQNLKTSSELTYPVVDWYRTFGGYYRDRATAIAIDSSDNIFVGGIAGDYQVGTPPANMLLVKYNSFGEYQWNRTWGGDKFDDCNAIALDSSDNVYLTGVTNSFGGSDIFLVKYDNFGEFQWYRTWKGWGLDVANGIALDSSDNIYLAGLTRDSSYNYDMCLIKYNNLGEYQWDRTWGISKVDVAYGITIDSNDDIYLGGYTEVIIDPTLYPTWDICLVKYNSIGEFQWYQTWGIDNDDLAHGIASDSADNVYLVGTTYTIQSRDLDICLIKYNSMGEYQWNRTWGGDFYDEGLSIALDSSDNIYVGGFASLPYKGGDMCLVKYNKIGEYQWNRTWGGNRRELCNGIALNSMDDIYLAGYTHSFGNPVPPLYYSDVCLVKYSQVSCYQGFGLLRIDEEWFRGESILFISKSFIQMELNDKVAFWEVTYYCTQENLVFYKGKGEIGNINVIIYKAETLTYVVAVGKGILFFT